ncbi:uncharacterized threonine-rich GPI-anchored glycoprotein PJ4664.02 isoform X2 [Eurytemora carolleeae]|uniref:uncharacterized threonine-rich GPI-anchored glycoprotein PJ4664.02 isoform X2 n=1 Tax=Eurytemora carolleeae TaxID=1294199 RepID=UPI000C76317B|nr:uncharacterized threonine-rich GPI-anchored glycoprotein PJ4664.02 isoform X2 [Eurytemora carolleeae]|eukprot:XP_023328173.1 uncharacterized threonine-rich GPI-anchored glycoprotein PJ4664.02-like isoform X2 [Eurytemora affinis]
MEINSQGYISTENSRDSVYDQNVPGTPRLHSLDFTIGPDIQTVPCSPFSQSPLNSQEFFVSSQEQTPPPSPSNHPPPFQLNHLPFSPPFVTSRFPPAVPPPTRLIRQTSAQGIPGWILLDHNPCQEQNPSLEHFQFVPQVQLESPDLQSTPQFRSLLSGRLRDCSQDQLVPGTPINTSTPIPTSTLLNQVPETPINTSTPIPTSTLHNQVPETPINTSTPIPTSTLHNQVPGTPINTSTPIPTSTLLDQALFTPSHSSIPENQAETTPSPIIYPNLSPSSTPVSSSTPSAAQFNPSSFPNTLSTPLCFPRPQHAVFQTPKSSPSVSYKSNRTPKTSPSFCSKFNRTPNSSPSFSSKFNRTPNPSQSFSSKFNRNPKTSPSFSSKFNRTPNPSPPLSFKFNRTPKPCSSKSLKQGNLTPLKASRFLKDSPPIVSGFKILGSPPNTPGIGSTPEHISSTALEHEKGSVPDTEKGGISMSRSINHKPNWRDLFPDSEDDEW